MTGEFVFLVRQAVGGWVVQGAVWTSEVLAKAEAITLAEGMAGVLRATGETVRVEVKDAANDQLGLSRTNPTSGALSPLNEPDPARRRL